MSLIFYDSKIFAGTYGDGVFISPDDGITWTASNNGLIAAGKYTIELAIKDTCIFAGTWSGMFFSSDEGANWTQINNGLPSTTVAEVEVKDTSIFVGDIGGLFVSNDNGANWTCINNGADFSFSAVSSILFLGNRIIAGGRSGISFSTNNGLTWTRINNGLIGCNPVYSMEQFNTDLYAAIDGNGFFISADDGGSWSPSNDGIQNSVLRCMATKDSIIFIGTTGGVFLSTDYGLNWVPKNNGFAVINILSVALSDSFVCAGTSDGIFFSTDNGDNWVQKNNGLQASTRVYSIEISGSNIYIGTGRVGNVGRGVCLSTDYGANWNYFELGDDVYSSTAVTALAKSGSFFVVGKDSPSFMGNSTLFFTQDSGLTWTSDNGLLNEYIRDVTIDGSNIFIGTEGKGIYLTSNYGENLISLNDGLSDLKVYSINVKDSVIFIGTEGDGILKRTLSSIPQANGTVYNDRNDNGFRDVGEEGLADIIVGTDSMTHTCLTDSSGKYKLYYYTDTFKIKFFSQFNYGYVSTDTLLTIIGNESNMDFGIHFNTVVWPGDANNDTIVDNNDLLSVGLNYGTSGIARDSISNLWIGQSCPEWTSFQANSKNMKHADCNGDGIVNAFDTVAINLNYGLTVSKKKEIFDNEKSAASLSVVPANTIFYAGDIASFDVITGDISNPVNALYGMAYDIHVDPTYIEPGTLNFTLVASWLGNPAADALSLSKVFESAGNIENAVIRTDHTDQSGYGKIGEFEFVIDPDIASIDTLHLSISYYNAVDAAGQPVTFNVIDTSIIIIPLTTSLSQYSNPEFLIYPNPVDGVLYMTLPQNSEIEILNIQGQIIRRIAANENHKPIDVSGFSSGMYFVKIITVKGIVVKKFIKE
ncbi:MAG: T9SS type A sorting domain-containing protein [Bacteroidota bacterium]